MYRQLKFVIWFPIVLVTVFAAGYLFWQKTLIPGPYDLEPVNVVRHQAVENTESLDTNNWKIYRDMKYGFEFKYPADWLIDNLGYPPYEVSILDKNQKTELTISPVNVGRESVFDITSKVNLTDSIFARKRVKLYSCPDKNLCPAQLSFSKAIKFIDLPANWERSNEIFYDISRGDEEIYITIEMILSTFRFIEPGSKVDKVCIQVITKAKNPQTGETRNFPTPCDVPEGWVVIK